MDNITSVALSVVIVLLLAFAYKLRDKRTREELLQNGAIEIEQFTILNIKNLDLKNSLIISISLGIVATVGTFVLGALIETEPVFIWLFKSVVIGVLSAIFLFVGQQRLKRRNRTPNFLISDTFSIATTMYVDHVGIDGEFMLKWSRVLTFEQVDTVTYKLTYRRKPMWLMTALKVNELIIRFEIEEDSQKFKDKFKEVGVSVELKD